MKTILSFLLMLILSENCFAFDREVYRFSPSGNNESPVTVSFEGIVFEPVLDLWSKSIAKDSEVQIIAKFLNRFYEVNKSGVKADILGLWSEEDKSKLSNEMTSEALEKNSKMFEVLKGMKLQKVIRFGRYYIVSVEFFYPGDRRIMLHYAMLKNGKDFLLTNSLSDNHFFSFVLPTLDEVNFK